MYPPPSASLIEEPKIILAWKCVRYHCCYPVFLFQVPSHVSLDTKVFIFLPVLHASLFSTASKTAAALLIHFILIWNA